MRTLKPLQTAFPRLTIALTSLLIGALIFTPRAAQSALNNSSPGPGSNSGYGPIVRIVSPEAGDIIKDVHPIRIAITPRKYPAQNVELLVDGHAVSGVLAAQTQFKWDTKLFVDGPHTLGVRVTDTQGFIGQTEITVYISNKRSSSSDSGNSGSTTRSTPEDNSPILRWLGVEEGQNLSGTTKIALETGGNFRIKYMFLNLNSAISPDVKPPLASWMTNRAPYEFSLDTTRYKDGLYVLDAYAWDAMENERTAPRLTVGIFNKSNPNKQQSQKKDEESKSTKSENKPAVKALAQSTPAAAAASAPRTSATQEVPVPAPAASLAARSAADTLSAARQTTPQNESASSKEDFSAHKFQQRTTTLSSAQITKPEPASVPTTTEHVASQSVPAAAAAPTSVKAPRVAAAPAATQAAPDLSLVSQAQPSQHSLASRSENVQSSDRIASAPRTRSTPPGEEHRLVAADTQERRSARPALSSSESRSITGQISSAASATLNPIASPTPPRLAHIETATATQTEVPRATSQPQIARVNDARVNVSTSVVSQSSTSLRSAPASIEAQHRSDRITSPRLAALPSFTEPRSRITTGAQPSATYPASATVNTRIAFSAPAASLLKITSTHAMPTAPRLAFSPNFNESPSATTAAMTTKKAAIVVAPSPHTPTSHIVQKNETLSSIAARYKVPASAIATANSLRPNAPLAQGTDLLLPQGLLISYQGQAVTGDVAPLLIGNVSVAPFRFLFEKQGGTMDWDPAQQQVIARNGDHEITLKIGSRTALVNQQEVMMDMAAFLLSGRTMVPIRFFEKALKAEIEWEPTTGRIYVAMTP